MCPSLVNESLWQIPQACTLIRTDPAPGSGISRSTISKAPPGRETCIARIFDMLPPVNDFDTDSRCSKTSRNASLDTGNLKILNDLLEFARLAPTPFSQDAIIGAYA
jgi:hypothetical protein